MKYINSMQKKIKCFSGVHDYGLTQKETRVEDSFLPENESIIAIWKCKYCLKEKWIRYQDIKGNTKAWKIE